MLAAVVLVAGVATVLGLVFTNTAHPPKQKFQPGKAQVEAPQVPIRLSAAERRAIFAAVDRFVEAGVARRDLAAAYDLTTPDFRGGVSRAHWAKGETPIYPYPVAEHSERIQSAFQDGVMVQLLLKPRRSTGLEPLGVDLELKPVGTGSQRRWLVDYYLPRETLGSAADRPRTREVKDPGIGPHLTRAWLLVPAGIFALILLVPLLLGVRDWLQGRAAEREYGESSKLPPFPPRGGGDR